MRDTFNFLGLTMTAAEGLALLLLAVLIVGVFLLLRRTGAGDVLDDQMDDLNRSQAELSVRLQTLGEMFTGRLDGVTHRIGQSMLDQTRHTADNLSKLNERLALIDSARASITALTSEVTDLRAVLSNKQARGAFGQGRMEAIISDALPLGSFTFQPTLTNKTRPDCMVRLPNTKEGLVIDAKFPLEAISMLREAQNDDERKAARVRVRSDVQKHVSDISGKYLIPGETQDFALMFVPSESLFADLHEHTPEVVEAAFRARVIVVSPSLLMMAIQVMQSLVRDARMREEAKMIQAQVGLLLNDVRLLGERVDSLGKHFKQTSDDVDKIVTSTDKITKRGERIAAVELADEESVKELPHNPTHKNLLDGV